VELVSSSFAGQFVNYNALHDYKMIFKFIVDNKIYSNCSLNLEEKVKKLVEFEKARKISKNSKRRKIYAIELLVMLPKNLMKSQKHQFIKEFMLKISTVYKRVIYIYAFEAIGNGSYCRIIAFQRMIYNKPHFVPAKYKRDMYINKNTGQTCSKDDVDAIRICKKNEVKKDKENNVIYQKVTISPKKYRCLNFKDSNDIDKKLKRFNSFKNKLQKKVIYALSRILGSQNIYMKLRHKQFKKNDTEISKRILYYNSIINQINIDLQMLQNTFYYRGLIWDKRNAWKRFEHIFFNINQILNNGFIYLSESNEVKISIDPKSHIKASQFHENMEMFKTVAKNKIRKWYLEEFYDSEIDKWVKEEMYERVSN